MTKPLPDGAQRQRQARSCIACRALKVKCVGAATEAKDGNELAIEPCQRCTRIGAVCCFASSRRKGRPRRLVRSRETEAGWDAASSLGTEDSDGEWLSRAIASGALSEMSGGSGSEAERVDKADFCVDIGVRPVAEYRGLDAVAEGYLQDVYPYLPILAGTHADVVQYLTESPPALAQALATLVYPRGPWAADINLGQYGNTLVGIQMALFLAYSAYGRGNAEESRSILEWAGSQILGLQWHRVDALDAPPRDPVERDMIRHVFYETFGAEVTLGMVTGVYSLRLYGHPFCVNEPNLYSESSQEEASAFSLKVRAFSVLALATGPPSEWTVPAAQCSAICTTLALLGRKVYTSAANRVDREAAFIALMMASQALIYIQSVSFASTAFTCGLDNTIRPSREARALALMASEIIFATIRESLLPTAPRILHSPFFSCALLVGANGALMTLRAKLLNSTYLDDPAAPERPGPLSPESGGTGPEGTDDSSESDEEESPSDWRAAVIANHLDLAEWFLTDQVARWPRSQRFLDETRLLRSLFVSGTAASDPAVRLLG